jgi:hypothetical protein
VRLIFLFEEKQLVGTVSTTLIILTFKPHKEPPLWASSQNNHGIAFYKRPLSPISMAESINTTQHNNHSLTITSQPFFQILKSSNLPSATATMQLTLTPILAALLLGSTSIVSASLVAALPVDTIRSVVQRDAAPSPDTPHTAPITKRATIFDETCGGTTYDASWVQGAYDALTRFVNTDGSLKPSAGTRTYPQPYQGTDDLVASALGRISGCEPGQAGMRYNEFPLLNGEVWNGGPQRSQGPARVIAIGRAPTTQGGQWTQLSYCLSVYHPTEDGAHFPCTESG